jgi:hypothetical protein
MHTRRPGTPRTIRRTLCGSRELAAATILLAIVLTMTIAGCGAPGEPQPPIPPTPVAVADLIARQVGDAVVLTFTIPGRGTLGEKLKDVPTFEVLRGSLKADGTVDTKSFRVVDTVPGSLVGNYLQQGKVQFSDPVAPDDANRLSGQTLVYEVRTRVSIKKTSDPSNDARVVFHAVPTAIDSLTAEVTAKGVSLKWSPPRSAAGSGEPVNVTEYHVYRGEFDPAAAASVTSVKDLAHVTWKSPLVQIATATSPEYLDSGFDYGKTYAYVVRSLIVVQDSPIESGDSVPAIVTPKDTFPPDAPQGLVATAISGQTPGSFAVELSWSINVESDFAGYRVYRSETEGSRGPLLTQELLLTPTYRDATVSPGQHYWYTVTAVDRAGNESAESAAVAVEVPEASQ